MSATIIPFPSRSPREQELELMGRVLRQAILLPAGHAELALLMATCESLLSSYDDDLCDSFLARLTAWRADNRRLG